MSGISVKNSWPNCSPGHRLHITVKHRATVVKMKGRSGGKDHINDTECGRYFRESAQMGVGGGCILYIIFDLVLEAKIAVPAVSPHLTLYRLGWNSYFGLQYEVKIDICINSAPLPPTKKGGPCLPAHAWCLLVSSA